MPKSLCLLATAAAVLGCHDSAPLTEAGPIATRVVISPRQITLHPRQTMQFMAVGLTVAGDTAELSVRWQATGGSIVDTVSHDALHYATYQPDTVLGDYVVIVSDRSATTLADTSTVSIARIPVASVTLSPAVATVLVGATLQLAPATRDSSGRLLSDRVVTWASTNPAVATVSSSGVVTGQVAGSATITATSEGQSGAATVTVASPPTPGSPSGYYVAPNGAAAGNGSASNPWDLQTALNQPANVHPGDTIWLRGGTYTGAFTSSLTGTAPKPIVVRQYPGERATIRGNLVVFGAYTWYWGFEVVSPNPAGGNTNGVQSRATGAKYINLVIHDAQGVGLTLFDDIGGSGPKPDQEAYGCLLYNNGNLNNNSHGLYANNHIGYRRVRDNIAFNNWALGLHVYGSADNVHESTLDGNISFNNGAISGYAGGPSDLLIGGPVVTGAVITNNYLYRVNTATATADIGYYFGPVNQDLIFTGNYAYGLVQIEDWVKATVTGNTFYSTSSPYAVGARGELSARGNLTGQVWSGNIWYGDPSLPQWGYGPAGATPGAAFDNAAWIATTGLTGSGTYGGRIPPNLVVVRPNGYEAGRANIVVYNWAQLSNVSVDVTGVLSVGDRFVVQNAQDFYGPPALSGTYTGNPLQLPTAGVPAPTPIGRGVPGPITGPTFSVFVLMRAP